ncbi:hypothetical protein LOK49_LG02G01676 [Camellia lanceoleosa]|uniref:Uncharacterized protein n=1 Tax=Camellia lanceoleosa TaxID=1840588 RepID=A0ACC0IU45_9ERIC|nr:hypothetical protein LOK49_LG02G01676 [Camellia lanceoleosa]
MLATSFISYCQSSHPYPLQNQNLPQIQTPKSSSFSHPRQLPY